MTRDAEVGLGKEVGIGELGGGDTEAMLIMGQAAVDHGNGS